MATADATGGISNPGANVANYGSGAVWNGQTGNVTTVGSAAANNYFGTADQAGNVWEWTDATGARAQRAGAWINDSNILAASYRGFDTGTFENANGGFRVASVAASVPVPVSVPEPSAFLVSMLLVSAFLIRRRRSTR